MHRLWVNPPVEFSKWRDVAWKHAGAAHDHAALHPARELRLNANGEGKVGERPQRNEFEFAWLLAEGFNHLVHSVVARSLAALQRQPDVAHAVGTMHMLRGGEGSNERHLCTCVHRNGLAAQLIGVEGILHAELHRNIADHDRHADDFGVRVLERHDNGDDVVRCCVGVDPHAAGWAHARIVSATDGN